MGHRETTNKSIWTQRRPHLQFVRGFNGTVRRI